MQHAMKPLSSMLCLAWAIAALFAMIVSLACLAPAAEADFLHPPARRGAQRYSEVRMQLCIQEKAAVVVRHQHRVCLVGLALPATGRRCPAGTHARG